MGNKKEQTTDEYFKAHNKKSRLQLKKEEETARKNGTYDSEIAKHREMLKRRNEERAKTAKKADKNRGK